MTTIRSIEREAFTSDLDLDRIIVPVEDCRHLSDDDLGAIAEPFNRYGLVVIHHRDDPEDPAGQVVSLGRHLGSTYAHNRADERGIVRMAPLDPTGAYLGATNREHPLHTDGAYDADPPPLLALQSVVPATTGGLSTVVSAKSLYDHLATVDPDALRALFEPDALHVSRANQQDTKAVFRSRDGGCSAVWRSDETATFASDESTQRAVALVKAFLDDPANVVTFLLEANQIIVLDNTSILHGRTAFDAGDRRMLNRINFLGDAPFAAERLDFGFTCQKD